MWADAPGEFDGHISSAAPDIQTHQPSTDTQTLKQRTGARMHDASQNPHALPSFGASTNRVAAGDWHVLLLVPPIVAHLGCGTKDHSPKTMPFPMPQACHPASNPYQVIVRHDCEA